MPKPSAGDQRLTAAFGALGTVLWLAACGGGGGGGGGGGAAAPAGSTASATATAQTASVTMAWNNANGPVAGYSVYVEHGDGNYKHEADVALPKATLYGAPGSTARAIVIAFDAANAHGPSSPPSPPFTFPAAKAGAGASAASASGATAALASIASALPVANPVASAVPASTARPTPAPAPALPGGALVWQAADAFRLTNAAIVTTRLFTRPAAGSQLVGAADFDADGEADLLWVSAGSELGYMPGSALRGAGPVPLVDLGPLSAGERVIGAGDFDGDGHGDVLVATANAISARLTVPGAAPVIADLGPAGQATLAGIADFDANGSDDIAWRTSTGALVIWLMDHGRARVGAQIPLATGFDWIAAGDFDGDGVAEMAVRGPDGKVYLVHPLAAVPALEPTDLANAQGWTVLGAVDLDRDRSDELVLATAGAIRIADLPGDQVVALDPQSPWQPIAVLR